MNTKRIKRHSISTQCGEWVSQSVDSIVWKCNNNLHLSGLIEWLACAAKGGRVEMNERKKPKYVRPRFWWLKLNNERISRNCMENKPILRQTNHLAQPWAFFSCVRFWIWFYKRFMNTYVHTAQWIWTMNMAKHTFMLTQFEHLFSLLLLLLLLFVSITILVTQLWHRILCIVSEKERESEKKQPRETFLTTNEMGFFSYYWLMGITENGMEWHVTYYAYCNAFRFFAQTEAKRKTMPTMQTKEWTSTSFE